MCRNGADCPIYSSATISVSSGLCAICCSL
jgi:hypothetical protein